VLVLALVLSAFAVGLDNFAAAIGIGLAGVDARTRLRVGVVFGLFEAGMPLVGILIGHDTAQSLGHATRYVGGGMLVAAGLWILLQARRSHRPETEVAPKASSRISARLVFTALGLSIDNLVVGFGLGVTKIPLAVSFLVFAVVSVGVSLAGLELGRRLGSRLQGPSDELAGLVLIAVGILVAANVF
jgi:manganese efflux pump family protein